jgi:hypothetical protein
MTFKRKALSMPTRVKLLEVGRELELGVTTNMRLDEMMDVVAGTKKRGILEKILDMLARDTLKSVCFAVGISARGPLRDGADGGDLGVPAPRTHRARRAHDLAKDPADTICQHREEPSRFRPIYAAAASSKRYGFVMVFIDNVPSIRMVSPGCRCDLAISARTSSRSSGGMRAAKNGQSSLSRYSF